MATLVSGRSLWGALSADARAALERRYAVKLVDDAEQDRIYKDMFTVVGAGRSKE